jgi:hypothetical protein
MADKKLDEWGPEVPIRTFSVGGNKTYKNTETVRSNLTNGQLWGIDPIPTNATSGYEPLWDSDETDSYAPLRPEPLWDSGDGSAPLRTEALWDSDETDANAPLRDEPLWDSDGTAWRPVNDLSAQSSTGDKLSQWGSEFDDSYAQSNFGTESIADGENVGSALSGQESLGTSKTQSLAASAPPTPPSTRPYIWKYQ